MELNTITCADCLDFMRGMEDKSVDLVITSPPYNFNAGNNTGTKYNRDYADNMDPQKYFKWQQEVILECLRISKIVFYNIQMIAGNKDALFMLMGSLGDKIKEIIIWDKLSAEPAINDKCLNSQFEFIFVFAENNKRKFDIAYFKKGELSNIFYIKKPHNWRNELFAENTATFPITLPSKIIINFSKENDIIYDPFMGMGTTALACIKTNRNFIGSEISQAYVDLANKRINQPLRQEKLAL